jgi:chain length determinant protein EpsF
MSLTQLLIVLRARWITALLVLVAVGILAAGVNLLLPKKYSASASVVLDVKSPDPIAGMVLPGMNVSGYMATQADVLQSQRVALRALETLKLDQSAALKERWMALTGGNGDFRFWLADAIVADLDVKPSRESNVLVVTYTHKDPNMAAAIANAFVNAYVAIILELRVEPAKQYSSFFDERAKQNRETLEKAQARLSAYQQQKGIVATEERVDIETARLNELSSQMVALQAVANESAGRQGQMTTNPNQMTEVLNNPVIGALKTDLSRQESKLTEISSRLGSQHPQVLELQASVSQLRERLEMETRRVTGALTVNNNVNQTRLNQLRAALDEQREKIMQLKGQRDEAQVLVRDVENAQRAYDAVATRVSQTSMESQTTQTNVSVLKSATPPIWPSSPRTTLNVAVALVLGILLSIGTVVLRETFDQRLRTEEDVMSYLKQPLLGALPGRQSHGNKGRLRLGFAKGGMLSLPGLAK